MVFTIYTLLHSNKYLKSSNYISIGDQVFRCQLKEHVYVYLFKRTFNELAICINLNLGTLVYAKYSIAVNGNFSAETRFKKYWKITEKLTKKPWKIRFSLYFVVSISRNVNNILFSKTRFCRSLVFLLKIKLKQKTCLKLFVPIHFYVFAVFSRFLRKFPIFLQMILKFWNSKRSLEITLTFPL